MRKNLLIPWMLLALALQGCQGFTNHFARIDKVCGVAEQPGTHYLQVYSSKGTLISRSELVVSNQDQVENPDLITNKGCVLLSDNSDSKALNIRHRNKAEGLSIQTQELLVGTTLQQVSLASFQYSPPNITCSGSIVSRQQEIVLYQSNEGLPASIYRIDVSIQGAHLAQNQQALLKIQEGSQQALLLTDSFPDGSYTITGHVSELFSPEQRSYPVQCNLTIDRTPPVVTLPGSASLIQGIVAAPGESIPFSLAKGDESSTLSACLQPLSANEQDFCPFQNLPKGQLTAPNQGLYWLRVKAVDLAGNVSAIESTQLRIFDSNKLQGLQSELGLIDQLASEQNGDIARAKIADLLLAYESLGTDIEKSVLRKSLAETLYSTYLTPIQTRIPKTEGTFVNWLSDGTQNSLIFSVGAATPELIQRNEAGEILHRWPLESPMQSSLICVQNGERILFVKAGPNMYRLSSSEMKVLPKGLNLVQWRSSGSCRYGKKKDPSSKTVTLIDSLGLDQDRVIAVDDLWILSPLQNQNVLLLRKDGAYSTQNIDGCDNRPQPDLNGRDLVKIFDNAHFMMKNARIDATGSTQEASFFQVIPGQTTIKLDLSIGQINSNDTTSQAAGGKQMLLRLSGGLGTDWVLYDLSTADLAFKVDLKTVTNPESIRIGTELIAVDRSLVTGILDLSLYNGTGTLLSAVRLENSASGLIDVMGHKILLNAADGLLIVDPLPHTSLDQTRNTSDGGGQWGPYWGLGLESFRLTRSLVETFNQGVVKIEHMIGNGQDFVFRTRVTESSQPLLPQMEKPLSLWAENGSNSFAFIKNQASVVLKTAGESPVEWTLSSAAELLRVDSTEDGRQLLVLDRNGQLFRKSVQDPQQPEQLLVSNLWSFCQDVSLNAALDFNVNKGVYFVAACQQVYTVNLAGQAQPIAVATPWEGSLVSLQSSSDGQSLLVTTDRTVTILLNKGAFWIAKAIKSDSFAEGLSFGRFKSDGSLAAVAGKNGNFYLIRTSDGEIREIRLPKSRPFTADDLSFNDLKQTLTISGPQGRIELPTISDNVRQELCQDTTKSCSNMNGI